MIQTKTTAVVVPMVIATVGVMGTAGTQVQHSLAAVDFNGHFSCDPPCHKVHNVFTSLLKPLRNKYVDTYDKSTVITNNSCTNRGTL